MQDAWHRESLVLKGINTYYDRTQLSNFGGFVLITYIYSLYTTYVANYEVLYGNLASIVVLMIWLYLLSYIFTIGLALNYRSEEIILEKTAKLEALKK